MREIGGYFQLEKRKGSVFHDEALALNYGRSCLLYLIRTKRINKLHIPVYLCDSVKKICRKQKINIEFYHIASNFLPVIESFGNGDWLYVVNYYGMISNSNIMAFKEKYNHVIIDNAQAYFQKPVKGVDTFYICRKFFGVPDGAFLYTDNRSFALPEDDYEYVGDRIEHIIGRYEHDAGGFYQEYLKSEEKIADVELHRMSQISDNFLRGLDYEDIKNTRERNYDFLQKRLAPLNSLDIGSVAGSFMYPLFVPDGNKYRRRLADRGIYIPLLWPNVIDDENASENEKRLAKDILPLPCDQRYTKDDMAYMSAQIEECVKIG